MKQTRDTNIIIGHTTDNSVKIWLKSLDKQRSGELLLYLNTEEIKRFPILFTNQANYISIIELDGLSADTSYNIKFKIGSNTFDGSFRTFPLTSELKDFTFLFSSCLLNMNLLIRKSGRVFENLARIMESTKASFMQFCGDQIYVDTFNVTTPKCPKYKTYEDRYLKNWSLNGSADFFANHSSYMILDDHEIANDFDNSNPDLSLNKLVGLQVYEDYQHAHNPDTEEEVYFYSYQHGDVHFFVLDTRTERNRVDGFMISDKQEMAFFNWLDEYKDQLKIVISPVPFIIQPRFNEEKWMDHAFRNQYYKLIQKLIANEDPKLVFITGDYHCAVHGSFTVKNQEEKRLEWHEFMAGPLNQVLVNKGKLFLEDLSLYVKEDQDMIVQYKREQVESKYTNTGAIQVRSDEENYYVKTSWYRVQHESDAVLIADCKELIIAK